ncbi:amidase family protein [Frigidibacter sp. SD6-1]|uniref:amidase family protein n=1 Tax=Frigidibacter sp. SD6-1 TaxID=3032581 RepID=UPI0024DF6BA2|nr:amidase family protein [Frigidibacter sp. SD6-1]
MSARLSSLAEEARAAGDRLLHARRLLERWPEARELNAIATPAPLSADGPDGPLYGVPVTVKDSYETAGLRTTASHPPLADHVPGEDASLVARLKATGAVILGKTNLAPLCGDAQSMSPLFGTVLNPWNPAYTPGGSGGGGAAAVAAGLSRLDLGSDLGGSVRLPAHYCGVAALKMTEGRFDLTGHIPPFGGAPAPPFQSAGLIARDCADLAEAFAALAGEPAAHAAPGRLTVAQITDTPLPLCPRTRAALAQASAWIAEAGHRLEPCAFDMRRAWRAYGAILTGDTSRRLPLWRRRLLGALALTSGRRPVRQALLRGLAGQTAAGAEADRGAARAEVSGALETADLILLPVSATAAFRHLPKPPSPLSVRRIPAGRLRLPYMEATIGLTIPFSLTGHPVIVLPVDCIDGLPVGVQLVGRPGEEQALLAAAQRLEADFARHRPPLWQTLRARLTLSSSPDQEKDMSEEPLFTVVLNGEEQYSIWPEGKPLPAGWTAEGFLGPKSACLDHIATVWTDMRPASLRRQMAED